MEPSKLKRDLIILLVSSFIVIVCWIGFNIYSKAVTSTVDATLTKQIIPIEPSFDTATISNISQRQKVEPVYEIEIESLSPTPEPIFEEEIIPTPSLPLPTPTDTETTTQNTGIDQNIQPTVTPGITGEGVVSP